MRVESRGKRRRRKGQIFLGHRDAVAHGRCRFERIIHFFFFSHQTTFPARFHSMSPHRPSRYAFPFHLSLPRFFSSTALFTRARTTYAWNNESERTEYRKRGIRGRDMHEEFDRAYRKTEEYFSEI